MSEWGSLEDLKKIVGRRYIFPFAGGAIGNSPFSTDTVNLPNYHVYDFSTFGEFPFVMGKNHIHFYMRHGQKGGLQPYRLMAITHHPSISRTSHGIF